MSLEEAFAVISRVCNEFRGTLEDHKTIQAALKEVRDAAFPPEDVKSDDDGG